MIVHAYEQWGEDAFVRFNGQFAVALWDSEAETLVLARDRLGVRPIYLCEHAGRLWFASEVKAIFAGDPSIPRALDPLGLAETFTFWTTIAPQTVFVGVTELEPGHVRTISRGRSQDRAFWEPRYPVDPGAAFPGSLDEAAEQVRAALEESVRLRMLRADVPVGSYLSGGLDSSLVAALGRRVKGERVLHVLHPVRGCRVRRDAVPADAWPPTSRAITGRSSCVARTSRRPSPMSSTTPSARSCGRRRRRSSCCRAWCTSPASRSC